MKKYYKFIFIALFGLFIFLPKDTFASTDITVNTYEFFWDAVSPDGSSEIWRGNLLPMQRLRWGDAYSNEYNLIRIAPLLHYNALAGDSTYNATLNFYVETIYPYDYEDVHCSLYSDNNTVSSCSVEFVNETQIDSTKSLMFFKVSYQWTTTADYVEFWLNFDNFMMSPVNTYFFYNILDFKGNVDKNQIIIDGLGETNKKIDETNKNLKDIEDSITSEDAPNLDSLNDSAGWLPAGPVDSILNLPLSLFQNLTDNLSKSCQPVFANLPYVDKTITLPCISTLYAQMGVQDFLNWVGIVVGALILYNYFLKLYQWVDDTLTFRENNWQDWGGV